MTLTTNYDPHAMTFFKHTQPRNTEKIKELKEYPDRIVVIGQYTTQTFWRADMENFTEVRNGCSFNYHGTRQTIKTR